MKHLVLAAVIFALLMAMVAPELMKLYPQQLAWFTGFASGSWSANLGAQLASDVLKIRELLPGGSNQGHDSAASGQQSPATSGDPAKTAPGGAAPPHQGALSDWEKAKSRGKRQIGPAETAPSPPAIVFVRSKSGAPQPPEPPKTGLSPKTVVISGELTDPSGDSIAEAAKRSRANAEPQPSQSR